MKVPFNKAYLTGKEFEYMSQITSYSGDGNFTRACNKWMEDNTGTYKALLTNSCTAALEMSALLADIQPGDEIIMPSYTFVSTANAFVLRGAIPVFVDIRPDTLNIDETLIEAAITSRTKAIVPVHYAGVGCEMDVILKIASKYNLFVIEDAAQGVGAFYKNQALGTFGQFGTFSFHATKNIIAGEGGALLINDKNFSELAEIIREKGTDRSRYFRGQVDKYTWQHMGSSYLPSELNAAFLLAQLEEVDSITNKRLAVWKQYHNALAELEEEGFLKRPIIPNHCQHNAHMYYIIVPLAEHRKKLAGYLEARHIQTAFHYVPLHSSPAGNKYGRSHGNLGNTDSLSASLVRLPLFTDMSYEMVAYVTSSISETFFQTALA